MAKINTEKLNLFQSNYEQLEDAMDLIKKTTLSTSPLSLYEYLKRIINFQNVIKSLHLQGK